MGVTPVDTNTELFGGKELDVVGEKVYSINLGNIIQIVCGQHYDHKFNIENDITVANPTDGSCFVVRYDPYNRTNPVRENLTELSAIIDSEVLHARAYMDGVLELLLSSGAALTIRPKDKYEAWMYTFGNYILACPPGGFSA